MFLRNTTKLTQEQQFIKAAGNGCLEIVKKAIAEKPLLINVVDEKQRTALVAAAENGHVDVVAFLITCKNCDLDKQDDDGYNALIWATYNNHEAIVFLLLEANANVGLVDKWGNTPLYLAIKNENLLVINALMKKPGNLFDQTHSQTKMTAEEYARKLKLDYVAEAIRRVQARECDSSSASISTSLPSPRP